MLWIRHLDSLPFEPLAGTEGTDRAFWSPDSRSVAFVVNGQVKQASLGGGVQTVATLGSKLLGRGHMECAGRDRHVQGREGPGIAARSPHW